MSHASDDDQPLNFGSDLSIKACLRNCLDGEFCDCDHHRQESDTSAGQTTPGPYQYHTAQQSLQSIASSGRGPSQPRPIVKQQYQPAESMQYDYPSNKGRDQRRNYSGYPASSGDPYHDYGTGGIFIAPQYPSGFTTQVSSYAEGTNVTPFQQSLGCFRDGAGRLYNGQGQPVDEYGRVIQPASSSMPQSSRTSGFSDESFQTAPSHHSRSTGRGSEAGSGHSSDLNGRKKHKRH